MADLLFERALLAERRGRASEVEELLRRMSLYDAGASHRRLWEEPGRVRLLPLGPADALQVELRRLVSETRPRRRLLEQPLEGRGRALLDGLELPPGSYVALLRSPGRLTVRAPFVLRRNERLELRVELLPASAAPPGFVLVPSGPFLFGSAAEEGLRRDFFHHVPQHEVQLGPYFIARHETTFAEWVRYMEDAPQQEVQQRAPRVDRGGFQGGLNLTRDGSGRWALRFQPTVHMLQAAWGEPVVYPGRQRRASQDWRRFPVVGISAADAEAYAAWLSRTGRVVGARLCTEQEWEKAARGADGRELPNGARFLEPDDANYDDTYGKQPLAMGPDEVGSHPASRSPYGLEDTAGNVWEWTRSSLATGEYAARGGSWYFGMNSSRTTDREVTEPSFRDVSIGVRICADPPAELLGTSSR